MQTIMEQFPFLKATRFWALVVGAAAVYAKAKGWAGPDEMLLIATIMGGFIGIRTVDRYSEQAVIAEAIAAGQVNAGDVIKIPPSQTDSLTEAPKQ